MLKRLWHILGPLFCAAIGIGLLLFFYPTKIKHSLAAEKQSAIALSRSSFKSGVRKVQAMSDPNHRFVPFFGSSEWLRMDRFHPSVLAEAYQRDYTPYLLGQRGSASLTHYFGMQQITEQLENKQAIYFVSPQWFVKHGASPAAFQSYFSSGQLYDFLENQTGTVAEQYAAKRFLELNPTTDQKALLEKVAAGKALSRQERQIVAFHRALFQKEDALFSLLSFGSDYQKKIVEQAATLPKEFSYEALAKLATETAEKASSNNHFGIKNSFFNARLRSRLKRFKQSQTAFSYIQSPEYNDLQLALTQFAKSHTNVLFVIPPVNSKWAAYTGLSDDMYQKTVEKIKYQLQSQGFTNIADFSKDGSQPYFMQDTIHMGWNGWLAFDQAVAPFLAAKKAAPSYQLRDEFFSKEWADYSSSPEQFLSKN